jgi:hypothetical protein
MPKRVCRSCGDTGKLKDLKGRPLCPTCYALELNAIPDPRGPHPYARAAHISRMRGNPASGGLPSLGKRRT